MSDGMKKKKPRLEDAQSLTPRERRLLSLFRAMDEPERELLLSMAQKLIYAKVDPSES
jgi:hypothetical protein